MRTYLTDLSDAHQWRMVQPLLPPEAQTGRPRQYPLRTILTLPRINPGDSRFTTAGYPTAPRRACPALSMFIAAL